MTVRRFLLSCHDAGGTVPPMLALAQELVSRGHEVMLLSQPSVRARALAAGCGFSAFDRVGDYEIGKTIEEQAEAAMTVIAGPEIGDQLLALADERHADAVVLDCNLAGAAAAAETLDVPSAIVFHSMYRTFTDVWFAEFWPFMEPAINDTRRGYGLAPADSWTDVFAGHDRLISVVPASFDARVAAVPDAMRHFGFLVPLPLLGAVPTGFPDGDEPTVLVSLSTTYQHQEELLQRIVGALAVRLVRGLVTLGRQLEPSILSAPGNVTLVDYLDHGLVLDETDVLITHAGLGTVAAGLSHGVPIVCVPLGRDQHLNAERVADVGAGIALASAASSDEIGEALDQILSDGSYRRAASAVSSASTMSGGAKAAIDDLESLLAKRLSR